MFDYRESVVHVRNTACTSPTTRYRPEVGFEKTMSKKPFIVYILSAASTLAFEEFSAMCPKSVFTVVEFFVLAKRSHTLLDYNTLRSVVKLHSYVMIKHIQPVSDCFASIPTNRNSLRFTSTPMPNSA